MGGTGDSRITRLLASASFSASNGIIARWAGCVSVESVHYSAWLKLEVRLRYPSSQAERAESRNLAFAR